MTQSKLTKKRFMLELTVKNLAAFGLFAGLYSPLSIRYMITMPPEIQESVISFMGFLMAAAIIGAFELSYCRTNLYDGPQRFLAHLTKFTMYSSILLLNQIALIAIAKFAVDLTGVMVMASFPILTSLLFYDFWDALRALDDPTGRR